MADLNLNTLFTQWLHERHEELSKKGSRLAHAYHKAIDRIEAYPDPIQTPRQLKGIQFVGDKLFQLLCSRLQKHCDENSIEIPDAFRYFVATSEGGKRIAELDSETDAVRKKRRASSWVPRRRSGSWAILVSLYTKDKYRRGLRKEDIVAGAIPYSDKSFTANPAARDFYSAWDGVKTLINRELIDVMGRPKVYVLTDEGARMAKVIVHQEGIKPSQADEVDVSFDNGVRVSPDSSMAGSSMLFMPSTVPSPLSHRTSSSIGEISPTICTRESGLSKKVHDVQKRIYMDVRYDVWAPEDYEVVLLMDNREIRSSSERDFFQTRISANNVACDVRALSVGDVLWVARHKHTGKEVVLNYVCERKRLDDLAMSIRDGRFAEQKNRLKRSGIRNVHYLVEEGGLGDVQRIIDMKVAIQTAISMVLTVSNFHVQRFRHTDETIEWLSTMTTLLSDRYRNIWLLVLKPQSVSTQDEYLQLLQEFREKFEGKKKEKTYECVHTFSVYQASLVKSNMMTVKEMFIMMLMSVRGVTFEKAVVLQQRFPTPRALIEFYLANSELSDHEKGLLIMGLYRDQVGGKKFNKATSIALYEAWGKQKWR